MNFEKNYYEILGVPGHAGFERIKKAYYRRAKECHPDRFAGDPVKEEAFKHLVEAFNVLSDPLQRSRYDAARSVNIDDRVGAADPGWFVQAEESILDTMADDILEEMIVGNTIPENSTLQTLMLDLEKTERFCIFREAKNFFYAGRTGEAAHILREYVAMAPDNILGHYYLARCHRIKHRYRLAEKEYARAVRIGSRRFPPLRMARIRRELSSLRQKHLGFFGRVRDALWGGEAYIDTLPPDVEMRRAVSRTINRVLARERANQRRKLEAHSEDQ